MLISLQILPCSSSRKRNKDIGRGVDGRTKVDRGKVILIVSFLARTSVMNVAIILRVVRFIPRVNEQHEGIRVDEFTMLRCRRSKIGRKEKERLPTYYFGFLGLP